MKNFLIYSSPLICLLLLFFALQLSRKPEKHILLESGEPEVVILHCDKQLFEVASTLIEAFQRRQQQLFELQELSSAELHSLMQFPEGDVFILKLQQKGRADVFATNFISQKIAEVQPVIFATSDISAQIKSWQDLIDLPITFAIAEGKSNALANCTEAILTETYKWQEILEKADYKNDNSELLARSVALKQVQSVITWLPDAKYFEVAADIVELPLKNEYMAEVIFYASKNHQEKEVQERLNAFFKSPHAKEILQSYSYRIRACGFAEL